MRKLNKTEQKIMDRLARKGFTAIERVGGHGPEGGKVACGLREWNAGRKLVAEGLVRGGEVVHSRDTRRGYTTFHASQMLYPLEEAKNG